MDNFSLNIFVPENNAKVNFKKGEKKQLKSPLLKETSAPKPKNVVNSSKFNQFNAGPSKKTVFIRAKGEKKKVVSKPFLLSEKFKTTEVSKNSGRKYEDSSDGFTQSNAGPSDKPAFIRGKGEHNEIVSKPYLLSEKFKTSEVSKDSGRKQEDSSEGFTVSFVKPKLFQKRLGSYEDTTKSDKKNSAKGIGEVGKARNSSNRVQHRAKDSGVAPIKDEEENSSAPATVDFDELPQKKRLDADFGFGVVRTNKWFGDLSNRKGSVHVQFPDRPSEPNQLKKISSNQVVRNENRKRKFDVKDDEEIKVDKKRRNDVSGFKETKKVAGPISSLFDSTVVVEKLDDADIKPLEERLFSRKTFEDISVHPHLIGNLEQLFGITNLTVVQKKTIPVLMTEKDALVRSQTGSGKTLAYAIPIMHSLQNITPHLTRKDGVKALIVLPTRELALQTYECFLKLMRAFTWIVPGIVIGGEKRKSEKVRLRKGITVLIGTPGRLLDHAEHTGSLSLHGIDWLIIDEADKLLEMGYEKDISQLIDIVERQRGAAETVGRKQTVLLSATLTSSVERLANLTLQNPVHIDACSNNVEETTDVLTIPQSLEQKYVVVPAKLRLVALASCIIDVTELRNSNKILVFMATQDMVDFYMDLIPSVLSSTVKFYKLHGNMSQGDRTEVFNSFRSSSKGVLLSTDVAARGLDLPKVDWIVQYTAPTTPAEYVHRVGRTARVGSAGSALLFLLPSELHFVSMLNTSRIKLQEINVDSYLKCLMKIHLESKDGQRWGGGVEGAATVLQHNFEHAVIDDDGLHELAGKAYKSWVRFYATYPKDLRVVFDFKSLHLGHHAKSFALRDPPKAIGGIGKPKKGSKFANEKNKKPKRRKADNLGHITESSRTKKLVTSEFDSGLKPLRKAF